MSEEKADQILRDIKLEMQQEMIIKAKREIEKNAIKIAKEQQAKLSDTSSHLPSPENKSITNSFGPN